MIEDQEASAIVPGEKGRALVRTAEALDIAKDDQQNGRQHPDLIIGRKQSDAERAKTHDEQRQRQHRLAADPVVKMAEQRTGERAGQKAHRVAAERGQRPCQGIEGRKEGLVKGSLPNCCPGICVVVIEALLSMSQPPTTNLSANPSQMSVGGRRAEQIVAAGASRLKCFGRP